MHRQHVLLTALLFLCLLLLNPPQVAATQPGSNGKIAFHSTVAGINEIFTIDANGSNLTQLTYNTDAAGPHYSADGQKILFSNGSQIFTMNADGTGQANLSRNSYVDLYPTYSPDGTKIVFQSLRNFTSWNIYLMAADGSGQTLLTTQGGINDLPAWSPDGAQIVFRHIVPDGFDGQQDLWIMNADGTGAYAVTTGAADDEHPSWAPDGSRIAFISKGRETNGDGDYEIYTVKPDGTDIRQLTFNAINDSNPNWAPDGSRIAFNARIPGGEADIYTMDPAGGSVVNLTNTPAVSESDPDWQPVPVRYTLTGFFAPLNMGIINTAKAGQAIPVKWRLVDGSGAPVADPGSFISLTSTATPGCGGAADAVETYAGASGLQYLGDGNWQYNWKTPRDYAGQCRTMVLTLKGNLTLAANFSFK